MACLSGLLSINMCNGSTLVQSLAGVDASMFHNLQKSDEPDIQDLFNDVNSDAERLFNDEFAKVINGFYFFGQESTSVGSLYKPVQFVPAFAGKQGILIEKASNNWTKITVKKLYLFAQTTSSTTIEFWDADMSILIASQVVNFTGGKNSVEINMAFDVENLFICYDGTVSKLFRTTEYTDNCGTCSCNGSIISGAKTASTPETSTLNLSSEMYGLGVDFSIGCDLQDLICFYQNELLTAYLYAFGAALKQEQFQTKKSNKFTLLKPEEIQISHDNYMAKLRESLESFIKNMTIPNGFCLKCKPFSTITYGL